MPRLEQIIPQYDVPHVMTVINDNSTVRQVTDVTASDPVVRTLCIFPSEKGPDGCKTLASTTEQISIYGYPDYKKYGQPSYMPYLSLLSGNANVHCIRITPPDALYSNIVIMASVTSATEGDSATATVTFSTTSITDLDDLSTFEERVSALATDGSYPLIAFASKGRGKYGNMYGIRLTSDITSDTTGKFKNYIIQVMSTEAGVGLKESYRVSMYPNAMINFSSSFMYDIINDPETGSSDIVAYVNETAIDNIYNAYVDACEKATIAITPVPLSEFDIFFGREFRNKNTLISRYTVASGQNLEVTNGIPFLNGSDGNFDMSKASEPYNPTTGYLYTDGSPTSKSSIPNSTEVPELRTATTVREAAIIMEYLKAMSTLNDTDYMNKYGLVYNNEGSTPLQIETTRRYGTYAISKRRAPTDYILDANYPDAIKNALIELALKRGDALLYLDSGIHSTVSELLTWDTTFSGYGTTYKFKSDNPDIPFYCISREGQWGKARDPFSGKIINVTYTWILASQLPVHFINTGNHIPFTGESYSLVTGFIANSIRPNIDADDLDTKDELFKRRINTVDTLSENRYIRSTQVTVQEAVSDLLENNNVLVTLEMKRMLESLVLTRLYDFSEEEDRLRFKTDADRMFQTYPNRKVSSYSIRFEMNEYERSMSILHCYLEIVYRQMATRGIIEIDINRRV